MTVPCEWCEGVEPFPEYLVIVCTHCGRRIGPESPQSGSLIVSRNVGPAGVAPSGQSVKAEPQPYDGTSSARGFVQYSLGEMAGELIADFRVEVLADQPQNGFRMFTVRLTGNLTGITAEEVSPVPEWALIRCWRKLAKELKQRAADGDAPASIGAALRHTGSIHHVPDANNVALAVIEDLADQELDTPISQRRYNIFRDCAAELRALLATLTR